MQKVFKVAVDAPLWTPLSYSWDGSDLARGTSVIVPLGRRQCTGVVLGTQTNTDSTIAADIKLKSILSVDETRIVLDSIFLKWLEWISDYYVYPIGQVVALAFPSLPEKGRKKAEALSAQAAEAVPELTEEQTQVLNAIHGAPKNKVHLLHGVTGAGKTEVYLRLLSEVIENNKQGLVLIPEIALTPQLKKRFEARFPGKVAMIHSEMTPRDRTNAWWQMVREQKSILLGPRSSLWCPIPKLDLIIVDEEHEPSFKQEEKLRFHARDAAVVLAHEKGIPIILGSATPSVETYHNAQTNKYLYHEMKKRVGATQLPSIHVVEMQKTEQGQERKEQKTTLPAWMSEDLFIAIKNTLEKQEQAAIFLNRRGTAPMVLCGGCGHVNECPNCSVSLTLHKGQHLVCHYCDYSETLTDRCPVCQSLEYHPYGWGTEQIEKDLQQLFPEARTMRADRDEIQSRTDMEDFVNAVENHEVDILIGTQMIAKGLDFPKLTLVGLVLADLSFHWPDFRASERSFQLMMQVSGRAGRRPERPGQVVIQTLNPEHPSLISTKVHDYKHFIQEELSNREMFHYPPFGRLSLLRFLSPDHSSTQTAAKNAASRLMKLQKNNPKINFEILGPTPSPLQKVRTEYRYQILLKSSSAKVLNQISRWLQEEDDWLPPKTKLQVDIDPLSMM